MLCCYGDDRAHAAAMFGEGVPEGDAFLQTDGCVSARMEERAAAGDKTCEGPRLTPWLVSSMLYYQKVCNRGLLCVIEGVVVVLCDDGDR